MVYCLRILFSVLLVFPKVTVSSECILDDAGKSDVSAIRTRLAEEREKRLLIQNDLDYLTLKLAKLERNENKAVRQIAFEAHPTKDHDVSSTEYTQVTFDTIVLNKGEAYDPESGVFTAPLSGIYYIQATLGAKPNKPSSFLVIRKGDIVLSYTWSFDMAIWNQQTTSTVVHISQGEEIAVYIKGHLAGSDPTYIHSGFSGFLVSAD